MKNARRQHIPNRTSARKRPETPDRRVRKTKASLHEALISLTHEKPYGAVAMKEVLARADVGRSTFYEHFRDKDDLLNSGIDGVLGSIYDGCVGSGPDRIVTFSLPLLEHIDSHRNAGSHTIAADSRRIMHDCLHTLLARRVLEDIEGQPRFRSAAIPPDLLAQQIASAFVVVLTWWLERRPDLRPAEVDAQFRAMVLPALRA